MWPHRALLGPHTGEQQGVGIGCGEERRIDRHHAAKRAQHLILKAGHVRPAVTQPDDLALRSRDSGTPRHYPSVPRRAGRENPKIVGWCPTGAEHTIGP